MYDKQDGETEREIDSAERLKRASLSLLLLCRLHVARQSNPTTTTRRPYLNFKFTLVPYEGESCVASKVKCIWYKQIF